MRTITRLALLATLALGACSDFFTDPAPALPLPIALSLAVDAGAAGGAASAFDRVDRALLRLERGTEVVVDTTLAVSAGGGDLRLRVGVDPRFADAPLTVRLELRRGGDRLFAGEGSIRPDPNAVATAEVVLVPVVAGLEPPSPAPTLTSLGQELQLAAAAVFATGDTVPGVAVAYRALDSGVVRVSPDGVAVAESEGEARVEASHDGLAVVFTVAVRQAVAGVDVEPAGIPIFAGTTRQFTATARDATGHVIPGRAVAWSSSAPGVLSIDGDGLATAHEPGPATVTATVEAAIGTAAVTVVQLVAPAAPTGLTAAAAGTDVMLAWADNDTTETGHEVLRRVAGSGAAYATVATPAADATSHIDPTGMADEQFEYRVRACNGAGCAESEAAVTETVPLAPANLTATMVDPRVLAILLEWEDRSRFEDRFLIEWRADAADPWEAYAELAAGTTTFPDTGEANSTDLYRILACNAAGCSAPSNEVTVTYAEPRPAPPADLTATVSDGTTITLAWHDSATTATRYEVQRRIPPGTGTFVILAILPPDSMVYVDATNTLDERFEYIVRACNRGGCTESDTMAVPTLPLAPTDLTLTLLDVDTRDFRLEWQDNSRFEEWFQLEWRPHGEAPWQEYAEVEPDSTVFDETGVPGQSDHFRVRACNVAGCTEPTGEVSITHPLVPPNAVTLSSTATAVLRGTVDGYATSFDVWFEWAYDASLSSQVFEFLDPSSGFNTYTLPLQNVQAAVPIYYRIVAENAAGQAEGQILSLTTPNLTLLQVPAGDDVICNRDPAPDPDGEACPVNPESVTLNARTTGPTGTYPTPFVSVEFRAWSVATGYVTAGSVASPQVADDGVTRSYTYMIVWSPHFSEVPPGTYFVEARGLTAGGARVLADGLNTITVQID